MFTFVLFIHVVCCIMMVFLVLLQSGRGAGLGAAFGSMGQASHSRGKMGGIGFITATVATVFMITSLTLAYLSSESVADSVVKDLDHKSATTTTNTQTTEVEVNDNNTEEEPVIKQEEAPPLSE